MSNIIGLRQGGEQVADIHLSNSVTQHFLAMLVLSGTAIAGSEAELDLVTFLAERDQFYFGYGMVGFDLNDMPWQKGAVEAQVHFLQRVIEGAKAHTGWERVEGWTPDEATYWPLLDSFRAMLDRFRAEDVAGSDAEDDEWQRPEQRLVCARHHAILYQFGFDYDCLICNHEVPRQEPVLVPFRMITDDTVRP